MWQKSLTLQWINSLAIDISVIRISILLETWYIGIIVKVKCKHCFYQKCKIIKIENPH